MLLIHLRKEDRLDAEGKDSASAKAINILQCNVMLCATYPCTTLSLDDDKEGMRISELVAWYLDQVQDEIDTEEELLDRKAITEKIIDRLIYHDQVIVPLENEGDDPPIFVHPNYVINM